MEDRLDHGPAPRVGEHAARSSAAMRAGQLGQLGGAPPWARRRGGEPAGSVLPAHVPTAALDVEHLDGVAKTSASMVFTELFPPPASTSIGSAPSSRGCVGTQPDVVGDRRRILVHPATLTALLPPRRRLAPAVPCLCRPRRRPAPCQGDVHRRADDTRRSVTTAVTRSAGVTSNAGFTARPVGDGDSPQVSTSSLPRSSIVTAPPSGVAGRRSTRGGHHERDAHRAAASASEVRADLVGDVAVGGDRSAPTTTVDFAPGR